MLTSFPVTFSQRCNINFPLEIGFLKAFQVLHSFSGTSPWIFLEIGYFSPAAPQALWMLSVLSTAFHAVVSHWVVSWVGCECVCVSVVSLFICMNWQHTPVSGILGHFSFWLTSLSMITIWSVHAGAIGIILFSFITQQGSSEEGITKCSCFGQWAREVYSSWRDI